MLVECDEHDAMRALIYDHTVVPLTRRWYAAVLERLPESARMLDVGIGTGGALVANSEQVRAKRLAIVGLDVDEEYLERCRTRIREEGLEDRVTLVRESVEAHAGGPYDAVYFSASFMLLADPVEALRHVCEMLAPRGRVFFTQTFENRRAPLMERLKPWLGRLTTIEFGRVTYREDFERVLSAAGVSIVEREVLGEGSARSYVLVVATPR